MIQNQYETIMDKLVKPVVGQYEQSLVRPFLGLGEKTMIQNQYDNIMNKYQTLAYPMTTGYPVNTNQMNYNYIMDKIFKTQFVNKPLITEVKTDVKIMKPIVDEQTLGKYVDPITGEIKYTVGDIKTVEDKMIRVPVDINTFAKPIDTLIGGDYVKDAILKKMYLNKVLFGNKKIFDQIYPTGEQKMVMPEYLNINKYETVPIVDKIEKINEQLNKYETINEQLNKYEKINEQLNKYENINEQLNKFENMQKVVPMTRTRRNAVYTPVAKPLTYTVPLTYGVQTPFTYGSPLTYTVPTTYTNQQYQVQPNLYYPGQTIYA